MGIANWSIGTDAIIGLVIALLLLIFLVANTVYWYNIYYEFNTKELLESTSTISKSTALAFTIMSGIGAFIVLVYAGYNFLRWYYNRTIVAMKEEVVQKVVDSEKKAAAAAVIQKKEDEIKAAIKNEKSLYERATLKANAAGAAVSGAFTNAGRAIADKFKGGNVVVPEPIDNSMVPNKSRRPKVEKRCETDMQPKFDVKNANFVCEKPKPNDFVQKSIVTRGTDEGGVAVYNISGDIAANNGGIVKYNIKSNIQPDTYTVTQPPAQQPTSFTKALPLTPMASPNKSKAASPQIATDPSLTTLAQMPVVGTTQNIANILSTNSASSNSGSISSNSSSPTISRGSNRKSASLPTYVPTDTSSTNFQPAINLTAPPPPFNPSNSVIPTTSINQPISSNGSSSSTQAMQDLQRRVQEGRFPASQVTTSTTVPMISSSVAAPAFGPGQM